MKGKITIDLEDGSRQVFDCDYVEFKWSRNPCFITNTDGSFIGLSPHTASIEVKGHQTISASYFNEKEETNDLVEQFYED